MTTHTTHHNHPIRVRALIVLALAGTLAVLVAATPAAATAGGAAVVIETRVDLASATRPVGTFEVTTGAQILGCSSGSFADETSEEAGLKQRLEVPEGVYLVERQRVMTCESGPMTGAIVVDFALGEDIRAIASRIGQWEVTGGRGDYSGVTGAGDFSLVVEAPGAAAETFVGTIDVQGPLQLAVTGARTTVAAFLGSMLVLAGAALVGVSRRESRAWSLRRP